MVVLCVREQYLKGVRRQRTCTSLATETETLSTGATSVYASSLRELITAGLVLTVSPANYRKMSCVICTMRFWERSAYYIRVNVIKVFEKLPESNTGRCRDDANGARQRPGTEQLSVSSTTNFA